MAVKMERNTSRGYQQQKLQL